MTSRGFQESVQENIERLELEQSFIHSKIDSWLEVIQKSNQSPFRKEQKMKELIDLGKFIFCYDQDLTIVNGNAEKPDFFVRTGDKTIGIEISDLITQPIEKQTEGSIRKVLDSVQEELRNYDDQYNGLYTVVLSDTWELTRENLSLLKDEVLAKIMDSKNEPGLASQIQKRPYSGIHCFLARGYVAPALTKQIVDERIQAKNAKLSQYSNLVSETWLVLTLSGVKPSDSYSYIEKEVLNSDFTTEFDKVFVLNFFRSGVLELKVKRPSSK